MSDWKRIIIAIDESPRSTNAIEYVGSIAGHLAEVQLCLLHVYPEPPPDYYQSGATLDEYKAEQEEKAKLLFAQAKKVLQARGIPPQAITSRCQIAGQQSISAAILDLQATQLELRFVHIYSPGCLDLQTFRAHGWKTAPKVRNVELEYEGESRIVREMGTTR